MANQSEFRDQQSKLLREIRELAHESRQASSDQKGELGRLAKQLDQTRHNISMRRLKEELSPDEVERIAVYLFKSIPAASEVATEEKVHGSLYCRSNDTRRAKIMRAHEQTFGWIFEHDQGRGTEFFHWLTSQHGIFWISGKSGSGESTLMKYLNDHVKTTRALHISAGDARLFTASFCSWNAGSSLQRSQEGLLRSLLYRMLRKCLELVPIVCPHRCDMAERHQTN